VVWVDPKKLKPHPKNRNKHPKEQIERLAQILNYQGFRKPVVVSNRSGFIVEGHGRIEAALKNKWTTVPVCYQDFEDETQEYAHLTADNAIALWAELDMSGINADTMELGPFDTDLLGIKNWESIAEDKYQIVNRGDENAEWVNMPEYKPGEDYIRIILHFQNETKRDSYVKENNLIINKKMNKLWIVNIE